VVTPSVAKALCGLLVLHRTLRVHETPLLLGRQRSVRTAATGTLRAMIDAELDHPRAEETVAAFLAELSARIASAVDARCRGEACVEAFLAALATAADDVADGAAHGPYVEAFAWAVRATDAYCADAGVTSTALHRSSRVLKNPPTAGGCSTGQMLS
jgi:hypothetical protein